MLPYLWEGAQPTDTEGQGGGVNMKRWSTMVVRDKRRVFVLERSHMFRFERENLFGELR